MDLRRVTFRLGQSGPEVGQLGIGTWAWGDRVVWGYGSGYTDSDLRTAFEISVNRGVRFFDTAEVYGLGRSERLLGDFLRQSGVESEIVVGTKFFPFPWRTQPGAVVRALRGSLRRLGMERAGLYQIHSPTPVVSIETLMHGLADAVEAGLTETVGVSNFDLEKTRRAYDALAERGIPLASNQVAYSLIDRRPEQSGLLQFCHERNITLIAYSPLGMGMLTGKYTPENPPPGGRRRIYNRLFLAALAPLVKLMREIGEAHGGRSPSQVALNWVIAKGALPIPGAKNARQADDNVAATQWALTEEEIAALDAAADRLPNR